MSHSPGLKGRESLAGGQLRLTRGRSLDYGCSGVRKPLPSPHPADDPLQAASGRLRMRVGAGTCALELRHLAILCATLP